MSPRWKVVTWGVGALALSALLFFVLRKKDPGEGGTRAQAPFPLLRLPRTTTYLWRNAPDDQPPQAVWSRLAEELCGGHDLFSSAMLVAENGRHHEILLRHMATPPAELMATLACGKRFAEDARAKTAYSLSFERASDAGAKSHHVAIVVSALEAPPPTGAFVHDAGKVAGLEHARCAREWHAHRDPACEPRARAAARIPGSELWARGSWADLRAFGEALTDAQELPRLVELTQLVASYPSHHVNLDSDLFFGTLFGHLRVEPFPELYSKDVTSLSDTIKKAIAAEAFGESSEELRFVLEARDEPTAVRLEQALAKYFAEIARRLRGEQPQSPGTGSEPLEVLAREQAESAAKRRARRSPRIVRAGKRIDLVLSLRTEAAEKQAIDGYRAWRRERHRAAAELVDALLAGSDTQPALRALGGDYLVRRAATGYRPYFEGRWHCPEKDAQPERYLTFSRGKLYAGEKGDKLEGAYTWEIDRERDPPEVLVKIDRGRDVELLRIEGRGEAISVEPGPSNVLSQRICNAREERAPVEPPPLRSQPFVFDLPRPEDGKYYQPRDLEALGLSVAKIDARQSLLQGFDPASSASVCFEPLPCEARRDCVTLEENLKIFRAALKPGQERSVSCEWAETGHCGGFRYFLFEGDIHRYEVRWFDADGKLVSQRNWTDYSAYCGGRAMQSLQGRVPYCRSVVRDELICGRPRRPVLPPLEDLRVMLRTAFERRR